jgi:hypothetical protein
MKIAFVAHTTQRGGAAISLLTTLRYLLQTNRITKETAILILPKGDVGVFKELEGRIPILKWYLPFSWIFVGAASGIHRKIYRIGGEILSSLLFRLKYNTMLIDWEITHVHLNSIVLWSVLPALPKQIRKTIHIREAFDTSWESWYAIRKIREYADKEIAISALTAKPFEESIRMVQIENPVDMHAARQLRIHRDELKEKMGIAKDTFVISIFSPIGLQKGYDFLESVMHKMSEDKKVVFLSVGNIDSDSVILYNQLLQYPNFKHISEQENLDELYAITDVVIRCEDYFPIGRTVIEGIYAGCFVLLPYRKGDLFSEDITAQMYLYVARSTESCTYAIDALVSLYPEGIINNGFEPTSNVKEVSEKLIEKIMQE